MRSGGYARSPSTALRIDSVTKQSDTKRHSERSEESQADCFTSFAMTEGVELL